MDVLYCTYLSHDYIILVYFFCALNAEASWESKYCFPGVSKVSSCEGRETSSSGLLMDLSTVNLTRPTTINRFDHRFTMYVSDLREVYS